MQDIIELLERLSDKYNFDDEDKQACRELIFSLENGDEELNVIDEKMEYPDMENDYGETEEDD